MLLGGLQPALLQDFMETWYLVWVVKPTSFALVAEPLLNVNCTVVELEPL